MTARDLTTREWAKAVAVAAETLTVDVRKIDVPRRKAPAWILTFTILGLDVDTEDAHTWTGNFGQDRFDTKKAAVAAADADLWRSRITDLLPREDYWALMDARARGRNLGSDWALLVAVEALA